MLWWIVCLPNGHHNYYSVDLMWCLTFMLFYAAIIYLYVV